MNETNPISTQWLQYYHQPTASVTNQVVADTSGGHSETTTSTIMTTSFMTTNTSAISSPNNSSTSMLCGTNHLNPQGGGSVARPIRRRSRASRRTPTTLLNASTTNFRSLVQQFTGCHNTYKGSSNSFATQKGPLNLSFGMPRNQNEHHNQQILGTSSSSRIAPFGCGFYNPQPADQPQEHHWHNQQQQQEHQEMYANQAASNTQSGNLDDFAIDDVSDLHELMDESSSFTGSRKDGYYF